MLNELSHSETSDFGNGSRVAKKVLEDSRTTPIVDGSFTSTRIVEFEESTYSLPQGKSNWSVASDFGSEFFGLVGATVDLRLDEG
jgi:hypothetical protein